MRGHDGTRGRPRYDRPLDPDLEGCFPVEQESGDPANLEPELPPHLFQRKTTGAHRLDLAVASRDAPRPTSASAQARDEDLPDAGTILDKYRIEEVLGIGGFAAVYRATHLILRMDVAIKMLRPRVVRVDRGLAAKLCEEARFAARINHPNVVRVHDVTHSAAITYVVMEYIDGDTLAATIRRARALPPREVLRIGREVTAGLAAGLAQGLVHRDIKPANIILSRSGLAKVVDFGLARPFGDAAADRIVARTAVIGTPAYMAPEQQAQPESVDHRADVYALGVTLYHAAVGALPFASIDVPSCMAMHRRAPVPPPDQVVPGFPQGLSRLLLWMLRKDPSARPATYAQLTAAFEEADRDLAR